MASERAGSGLPIKAPKRASKNARRRAARRGASLQAKIAATDSLLAKRRRQLEAAAERRASLIAKLAHLWAKDAASLGPVAYCLKEKRSFAMIGPSSVRLANGRSAIAGACSSCGSRLMRIGSV